MIRFVIRRILWLIPVLLGVITIVFILTAITPGDPVSMLVGENASEETRQEVRAELGLDKPLVYRYGKYIVDIVTKGSIGVSYKTKKPVWDEIMLRFPNTIKLALLSLAVAILVGVPLGVLAGVKQYSVIDNACIIASLIFCSMPEFWLGLMLILAFAVNLGWVPAFGIRSWLGWILPVATLGLRAAANIARISRSSMLDVVRQDYIRTARAKGQKESVVMLKHGLRNALIPIITNVGSQLGSLLGGAVTIETVFSISGIGKYMLDGLSGRDYPVMQGGVLILAFVFSIINLLVDIAYAFVDPRIKAKYKSHGISKAERKKLLASFAKEG
ncbi:MAG: ABC transporter permease [Parasporobacterium sp.]|nr:ABC transporter permease [Parasporobacterium sp.]